MLHPAEAGEIDHTVPPVRGSEAVTSEALAVRVFVRMAVKPGWLPAETLVASGILVMDTSPQFTATSAWAPPEPSLEVVKVAALCRLGHDRMRAGVTSSTRAMSHPVCCSAP